MTAAYQECVKEIARYVRAELQKVEELSYLYCSIEVSGRVHEGELKIKFVLGNSYDDGGRVEGGVLDAVLAEYMRRLGWAKTNAPLELSFANGANHAA